MRSTSVIGGFVYLLFILLIGCTPPNAMNRARGEFLCKDHGGLYSIHSSRQSPIECQDATTFDVDELKAVIITGPKYFPNAK